jgi:hypothetical protein
MEPIRSFDPHAIEMAVAAACPFLRPVAIPKVDLFSDEIMPPDLYPDVKPVRGYYVPVPPPPAYKVPSARRPTLVGERNGRQWTVHVTVPDSDRSPYTPTVSVNTYLRLLPTDAVPIPSYPWLIAAAKPGPMHRGGGRGSITNLAGVTARAAVGEATLLLGRLPTLATRPPVRAPMLLEAWIPSARTLLESPRFLEAYAAWEGRAGSTEDPRGPAPPVFKCSADRFSFITGIDLELDPSFHARTVREVTELLPWLEFEITGKDPETYPIPTIILKGPAGSVPDARPAYRCPHCGQLEILKWAQDAATGLTHTRTLNCKVDIFPPIPNRIRDVFGSARTALGN